VIYWILFKSGRLEIRERQPKNRDYVTETSEEVKGDFQHYFHTLTLTHNGLQTKQHQLHTYCGYDRGPKLEGLVRSLLEGHYGI